MQYVRSKVMKEGWTYKTFGEVGSFLRGKSIQKADFVEKGLPCIHYGQIHTKFGVSVDKHLTEIPLEVYNKSIIASPGDVIIAITSEDLDGSCKSTAWLGDYDIAVSAHAAVYKHNLNPKFIAYYLRSNSFYTEKKKYARGFKVMEIKPTDIARISLPVPTAEIQKSVVAELDTIVELINLKKAQLGDLDRLSQSIFYDMFGDPIENEKGWEVKMLDEVGEIISGSTPSTSDEENWNGDINWVTPAELGEQLYYGETVRKLTEKGAKGLTMMPVGTVLLSSRAPIGKLAITKVPMCCNQGFKNIICNSSINNIFLYYYLLQTIELVKALGRGATFKEVSKSSLSSYKIITPPIDLQQSFATHILSIEQQKMMVNSSVKELETLLASRMQYWFD